MRILFTTHQGGIAGSTYSICYLANGLADKGHEVHIACKEGAYLTTLISGSVILHQVGFESYFDWRSAKQLARIAREYKIDIVNAQSGRDRSLTVIARRLFGLKSRVVFTRRQRPRNEPWLKRWFHLSVVESIVVVSEGLRELFLIKSFPKNKLKVINNGVLPDLPGMIDAKKVEELKKTFQIQGKIIGCVARLKKQEQIIEALKDIPREITVLFIGINEEDLYEAIQKYKPMQRIIFTGRLPREEAIQYFKLLDVNILPSVMDGFGLVLVESMLLGIPVIGTNCGGIKSVIEHGKSGLLFENGDVRQLAEHINCLLTDEVLRNRLRSGGYERAKEFSMRKTVDNYETFFKSLLS